MNTFNQPAFLNITLLKFLYQASDVAHGPRVKVVVIKLKCAFISDHLK